MINHLRRLSRIGVADSLLASEAKHVIFLNGVVFLVLFIGIQNTAMALTYLPATHPVPVFMVLQVIGIAFVLLWNHNHRHLVARICFSTVAALFLTIQTAFLGTGPRFGLFLTTCVFLMFYLFPRREKVWMYSFVAIFGACFVLTEVAFQRGLFNDIPEAFLLVEYQFNTVGVLFCALCMGGVGYVTIRDAEESLAREHERSESLLRNILPDAIAARLKASPASIADNYSDVTILFVDIAGILCRRRGVASEESGRLEFENDLGNTAEGSFSRLVTVAFSAFDPFKAPREASISEGDIRYSYIGLKKRAHEAVQRGEIIQTKTDEDLCREFSDSLANCENGPRLQRWKDSLALLESDPGFRDLSLANLMTVHTRRKASSATELFQSLSSGHKIVLLTITRLVELIDERTLVLMDEPESHLHPPLLASLVRVLSMLLTRRNSTRAKSTALLDMISLPIPTMSASSTFIQCAADTANADLRLRLERSISHVMDAASAYSEASVSKTWHSLPHSIQKLPASDPELKALYPRTMSAIGRAGRSVYDVIFNSPPNGICPLCGQGKVFTLDHYLPRSVYAHFAILPINLIPSCRDCNFAKRERYPSTLEEQTFHPYFDDVQGERWLFCDVTVKGGVSLRYFVRPPRNWSKAQAKRAARHFEVFRLAEAFTTYAANELSTLKARLRVLFDRGDAGMVADDLSLEAASSRQANLNSWKTAAYEALAQSKEFCEGGFEQIAI